MTKRCLGAILAFVVTAAICFAQTLTLPGPIGAPVGGGGGVGGNDSNTVLLLHADGTNGSTTFTDSAIGGANSPHIVTANGNAQVDTADSKFGGASLLLDGNGDYLQITDDADFTFSGQFTIDFWIKTSSITVDPFYRRAISLSTSIELAFTNGPAASSNISFLVGTSNVITGNIAVADGSWHHVALTRDASNNIRLFVDGVQSGSTVTDSTTFNPSVLQIGKYSGGAGGYLNGRMDEIRFSNVARWTSGFTPPAGPYN